MTCVIAVHLAGALVQALVLQLPLEACSALARGYAAAGYGVRREAYQTRRVAPRPGAGATPPGGSATVPAGMDRLPDDAHPGPATAPK